jgi:hypothetical protein
MKQTWILRPWPLAVACALACAAPAAAQAGAPDGTASQSERGVRSAIDFLLHHQSDLGLTERQVRTLSEMARGIDAGVQAAAGAERPAPVQGPTLGDVRALLTPEQRTRAQELASAARP